MTKSKSSSKPSSKSSKTTSTELPFKKSHNLLGLLTKPGSTVVFDSIISIMAKSKYKTLLTADAPIYLATQREFWKNATLEKQGDVATAIHYSIKGKTVQITPQ
ncbi:hypothetical protein Hanom_Chr07g00620601 [Helianthus anomalus]